MSDKVWFIAGASRGLGREWAKAALARGDKVAATVRNLDSIKDLGAEYGDALLPLTLDVTDRKGVFAAIEKTVAAFGRIDVAISNAGYALFATIEESDEEQTRAQFEANYFGTLSIIQAVLPQMRAQGSGHILVTSSLAGIITFPTAGIYNSTKWAVEGLVDTLVQEVADFGIKVTLIEPGGYDTDWRGASSTHAEKMPEYEALRAKLAAAYGARKLGDPAATGEAILKVVDAAEPPLRLFLGDVAYPIAQKVYQQRLATWDAWADVAVKAQGAGTN